MGKVILVPALEEMSRITSKSLASATPSLEFQFPKMGKTGRSRFGGGVGEKSCQVWGVHWTLE